MSKNITTSSSEEFYGRIPIPSTDGQIQTASSTLTIARIDLQHSASLPKLQEIQDITNNVLKSSNESIKAIRSLKISSCSDCKAELNL